MMKDIDNPDVPIIPKFISIKHPANHETFLMLPANNVQHSPLGARIPRTFGIHHLTALAACQILTNEPGFLSSSSDRGDAGGVVPMDPDGILTLTQYYYHLTVPQTDPLYPLYLDFRSWLFPHNHLPPAWERTVSPDEDEWIDGDSWTVISTRVKGRDKQCRLSGWHDGISTAHIIPVSEATWMQHNKMDIYASRGVHVENDVRNLFVLRWDLLASLFDQARWVIVPKGGEMVVHFIRESHEGAALYHNQKFDTTHLSHEFLFARFAWAIIKQAASGINPGLRKRFRLIVSNSGSMVNEPGIAEATVVGKKRKAGDVVPSDRNTFQVNEAQELEEDLRLAKRVAPFFFEEPDMQRDRYHSMMWYPGQNIMERKKREYMDAHPNIRARSVTCPSLSSDESDAEEEDHQASADPGSYASSEETERMYE